MGKLIYKNGGKIITKNKQLILLITFLIISILSINAISASQIDTDNVFSSQIDMDSVEYNLENTYLNSVDNQNSISGGEAIDDSGQTTPESEIENTNQNTADNGEYLIKDGSADQQDTTETESANSESVSPVKTKIIVQNASVVKERNLVLQLLDSKNKSIANKNITIKVKGKTYTRISNKNGKISLKISLNTGKYTVKVIFNGDENYTRYNKTFTMRVYKLKTNITIPRNSVIRGHYFYAYLKDKNNKPVVSRKVSIKFGNKIHTKKTDKNGRFKLLVNSKIGKYDAKFIFNGDETYLKTSKAIVITCYKATTKITFTSKKVIRSKKLQINLKYGNNKPLVNRKIIITFKNKKYTRTTNKNGTVGFKISQPVGTYKIKVQYNGGKGYKKSSISAKIKILPNYTAIFIAKNKTAHRDENKTYKYYIRLTDLKGNPISGETVTIKVKCNNFTAGSGMKITKKTIVLSSDNICNKTVDKKRLNDMAKLLRAKGYKVIVSGIGPNYHVNSVRNYKNVCVFSLVGGVDSGMFVDMASGYYQNYLKKNNNQFVLGCVAPPVYIDLANRTWLVRAHDDNYSPKSFKGLYFPGKYLNKKTKVNYVYGATPKELVDNFLKYGKKGKSIGINNTKPGTYVTYKLKTSKNGYVRLDLPIGNHTIICSFNNKNKGITTDKLTTWVNVIK